MKHAICSSLLILVILTLYPNASGGAGETPRVISPAVFMLQSLQDNWFRYRTLQQQGESEGAQEALRRLKQQAMNLGIENLDALSAALIEDARKALEGGHVNLALDLTREAQELSPNYPSAYFFRGGILLRYKPWRILEVIGEYLNGWTQAGQHIWMLLYGFGNGLLGLIGATGAAIFIFIITVLIRYTPRLNHLLHELTERNLDYRTVWFLIVVMLLGPLWLGLGIAWVVIWWLIVFWVFMTGRERGLALLLVIVTASAGLWLPPWISVITARTSSTLVVMAQATRGEGSSYPGTTSFSNLGTELEDWRVSMALGLQYKRSGQYELARQHFEQAIQSKPNEIRLLINLANLYFLSNQLEQAIGWYQKALALDPNSVEAHYNLAQTYREKLMFSEEERHYQEAERLNANLTERYTRRALVALSHPVVDEPLTLAEVLRKAFTSTDNVRSTADHIFSFIWNVSLWIAPLIGLGFVAMVLFISRLANIKSLPFSCSLCGRSICQHCQKHIFHLRICGDCLESNKRVKKLTELRQIEHYQDRQMIRARLLSLFLPGSGHFFLLHSLKGFLFAFAFFTFIFIGGLRTVRFFAPYTWISAGRGPLLLGTIVGMMLIYLTVFWDLNRIRVKWREG